MFRGKPTAILAGALIVIGLLAFAFDSMDAILAIFAGLALFLTLGVELIARPGPWRMTGYAAEGVLGGAAWTAMGIWVYTPERTGSGDGLMQFAYMVIPGVLVSVVSAALLAGIGSVELARRFSGTARTPRA